MTRYAASISSSYLVLQNSYLLNNPEEKVEQISLFDNTPSRKSSDEIGFISETQQNEKEDTVPIQTTSLTGKLSEQQHISAADIKIGDRFLFQNEELTVSSLQGIYPDDISLIKVENEREIIRNANKFDIANYGVYLGNSKTADYTITDKNYGTEGGAKARFANNVTAIKLMKIIENENRTATPEEQEVLAKYVGWGGLTVGKSTGARSITSLRTCLRTRNTALREPPQ